MPQELETFMDSKNAGEMLGPSVCLQTPEGMGRLLLVGACNVRIATGGVGGHELQVLPGLLS